jgi:hypothetical protein
MNPEASPFGAVHHGKLFQPDDTVREAVQAEIVDHFREVVEEQYRTSMLGEEVLEGENLAAKPKSPLRQKTNFR